MAANLRVRRAYIAHAASVDTAQRFLLHAFVLALLLAATVVAVAP